MTADDRDLADRQAWDTLAFGRDVLNGLERYCPTHDLFDCPFAHGPVCATCRGTKRETVPDPTAHAYFPKPYIQIICRDCDGKP